MLNNRPRLALEIPEAFYLTRNITQIYIYIYIYIYILKVVLLKGENVHFALSAYTPLP